MLHSSAPRQSPRMNSGCDPSRWSRPSFICGRQTERAGAAVNPDPSQLRLLTAVEGGKENLKGNLGDCTSHLFSQYALTHMDARTHTHTLCLSPLHTRTHIDKHAAAWTLKIRSWSCEREGGGGGGIWGGGGLLGWCVCMFVSVCVCFSFSAEGEGDRSTGRPEELLKQAARHVEPYAHSSQSSHTTQMIINPPKANITAREKWTPHPSKYTLNINELTTRVLWQFNLQLADIQKAAVYVNDW